MIQVEIKPPPPPTSRPTPSATAKATLPAADTSARSSVEPVPSPEFLALIPHDYARRHLILSAGRAGLTSDEDLLVSERTSPTAIFNTGVRLGRPVRAKPAPAEQIAAAIDRAYAEARRGGVGEGGDDRAGDSDVPVVRVEGSDDVAADLDAAVQDVEQDLLSTAGKAPAVRLVDLILFEALLRDASDVHIQPLRDRTLIRYRLDGALHTVRELPASIASSVVSRIKVMGRLDVAEHRAPQDGRATVNIGAGRTPAEGRASANRSDPSARTIDLRISIMPSTYGQRVVLRLLDPARSPHLASFGALGMPADVERRYLEQAARASGIVLSTGPTGSGKTTTLYATLAWLSESYTGAGTRGCELNMMTIEDPVEYDLSGNGAAEGAGSGSHRFGRARGLAVSQTQVDPKKSVTFATGLRHILRQDPDVIMVGEIRDQETARIAVQASLTGHLVLSTLHTNDAASAIARLLDLGVEPFLVCSSLSAVLAQRLVRKRHAPCEGIGCPECLGTGFKGRTGVFELLVLDAALRELIAQRSSAVVIKDAAERAGMVTLREMGRRLVRDGLTIAAEVARVIDVVGTSEGEDIEP